MIGLPVDVGGGSAEPEPDAQPANEAVAPASRIDKTIRGDDMVALPLKDSSERRLGVAGNQQAHRTVSLTARSAEGRRLMTTRRAQQ